MRIPSLSRRLLGALRHFDRRKDGTAAIEFSLVAIPFFGLSFALLETMLVFYASTTMENGINQTARLIRTGQVQAANMTETEFRDAFCLEMTAVVDCAENLIVDVRSFDDFGGVVPEDPLDSSGDFVLVPKFEPGSAGDVVLVRVFYQWDVLTPIVGKTLTNMSGDKRLITSAAVFRNEPFAGILPGGSPAS